MKLKDVSIEESVVTTMDGDDAEIFPYLPYILQNFWEIGSSPSDMIELTPGKQLSLPGYFVFG